MTRPTSESPCLHPNLEASCRQLIAVLIHLLWALAIAEVYVQHVLCSIWLGMSQPVWHAVLEETASELYDLLS